MGQIDDDVLVDEDLVGGECCASSEDVCVSRTALAIGSGATILLGMGLLFTTISLLRR